MRVIAAVAGVLLAVLLAAAPGQGAYPGQNGRIVYDNSSPTRDLWTANPDASGQQKLVDGPAFDPVWSPDGQRVAFVRGTPSPCPCPQSINVVNADGTGEVEVTTPEPIVLEDPTWSPDGERIAFARYEGLYTHIWVMDADGSNLQQITDTQGDRFNLSWSPRGDQIVFDDFVQIHSIRPDGTGLRTLISPGPAPEYAALMPDWSPDGSRIAYQVWYECDGDNCGDIRNKNMEGPGETTVRSDPDGFGGFDRPSWSPDGTRIVVGGYIAASDGTSVTPGPGGSDSDWQPLPVNTPSTHIRPKGATPIYASLVTVFRPCTSSNRQHGPPLAHPSCNPPVPESPNLAISVGETQLRSIGSLRARVLAGTPGGPDDTDVQLTFSLTNVMKASDHSEYSGELQARIPSRVTDREGSSVSSTTQEFSLSWNVPCAPTADPQIASACTSNTTLDAVLPGAAAEGTRAIWALDAVQVHDGGPDGDADTPDDNSLFMKQGVFVP